MAVIVGLGVGRMVDALHRTALHGAKQQAEQRPQADCIVFPESQACEGIKIISKQSDSLLGAWGNLQASDVSLSGNIG
ncbi:hypothetical protein GCM10011323_07500 [Pontibacter amylolyticus]|uniref:Uncharacterized protein n=1 Tax=Pontibacter amylolyticus TaxID=1424080 RepID=A0ABQ1W0L2_9BACT|nr:hypothetical protein GCM10011323_07500 [Pontibacter amylolyticus]